MDKKDKIALIGLGTAMLADALRSAQLSKIHALPDELYTKGASVLPDGKFEIPADKSEIHAPAEQEYKYAGDMSVRKGVILWEYNYELDTLQPIETKNTLVITDKGERIEAREALRKPDTIYIKAINKKNAQRKVEALKKSYLVATGQLKID